jgi:hypothetical protein
MPHNSQDTKKAKITVYRPRGKKCKVSSGSIVILKPTKTRRGKTIYTEVDAAPYYKLSDEGDDELPKRKHSTTPSHFRTTAPASLDDVFQCETSCLNGQEPYV